MRKIQFRAWDVNNKRMIDDPYRFSKSYGEFKSIAPYICFETWQDVDDGIITSCHIMQSTELRDGLGNTIFEGDTVKRLKKTYQVDWIDGSFHLTENGISTGPIGFEAKNGVCLKLKVTGHVFKTGNQ